MRLIAGRHSLACAAIMALASAGAALPPSQFAVAAPSHLTIGWYTGDSDHYLTSTIDALPFHPRVVNYFASWDSMMSGVAFNRSFVHAAAIDGVVTFIRLEPWGDNHSKNPPSRYWLKSIAAGSSDSRLRLFGQQIAAGNQPVWVSFADEMNTGAWYPWNIHGTEKANPATWIEALNRVTAEVNTGAGSRRSLISWAWVPNLAPPSTFRPYWSSGGQSVKNVGILGLDAYLCHGATTGTCTETYATSFMPDTAVERSISASLPIMLTETGIGGTPGIRGPEIQDLVRQLRADPARVAGLSYFNQDSWALTVTEEEAFADVIRNG
jgi:hypothetical protein